ncbi:MAG: hypothetical protein ACP5UM_13940, partial [Anaerolineae bacterium]
MRREELLAQGLHVAPDVALGEGLRVKAESGEVGTGVRLGARSRIVCRHLVLEDGVQIGDDVELVATEVHLGRGASIAAGARITVVDAFRLGR